MNKYYIIIPIVFLVGFIFVERNAAQETHREELRKIEEKKEKEAAELAKKKDLEEKARLDSEKRNAQRLAEEKEKEAKKKKEYDDKIQKMKDDLKKYTDGIDQNTRLVAKLEKDLAEKRELRERENRAAFELAKKVEISKKLRRDAELEVQRFTEMLTARANESTLTKMPVVATAENPAK